MHSMFLEVWTGLMQVGGTIDESNIYFFFLPFQSVGASRKVFEYIDRKPALTMHGSYMRWFWRVYSVLRTKKACS